MDANASANANANTNADITNESISIIKVASSFPPLRLDNHFFGDCFKQSSNQKMFMGTKWRHHIAPDQSAVDLIHEATSKLNLTPEQAQNIDIIMTNVSIPDEPFMGCGAHVANRLNVRPKWIFDLHNGGCVAFLLMLDLVRDLMLRHKLTGGALLCNVQTAAGRVFSHSDNLLKRPQSAIPGDGCGVAYIERGNHGIVLRELVQHSYPELAPDMFTTREDGSHWWEPSLSAGYIDFNEEKTAKIIMRGNRLVPQVVREVCEKAQIKTTDIETFITNQPNSFFLRNWREAIQLPAEKQVHTFEEYANLFGAALPINLERAITTGKLKKGEKTLCMAGFSHAGDYAATALFSL